MLQTHLSPPARWRLPAAVLFLLLIFPAPWAGAQGNLENPGNNSFYSGIGVVSGWKCTATGPLTVRFNGGTPVPLVYGSERGDTASVCGDTANGFIIIQNWALLGDGTHTAVVYDNGVEFGRNTFDVATTGADFLRGAAGECQIAGFPAPGEHATFRWNQHTQHPELIQVTAGPGGLLGGRVYWVESQWDPTTKTFPGRVHWARLDHSDAGSFAIPDTVQGIGFSGLVADPVGGKLYLLTSCDGCGSDHRTGVYRVNLDGTQFEEVRLFQHKACSEGNTSVPCPDLGYTYGLPRYIAFDPVGNTLYLSMHDSLGGGLFRMNSDGTQYEQVIGPDAVRNIIGRPIEDVSVNGGRIHFKSYLSIWQAHLDGSGLTRRLGPDATGEDGGFFFTIANGRYYWVSTRALYSVSLSGTDAVVRTPTPTQDLGTRGRALVAAGGSLYWQDRSKIVRWEVPDGPFEDPFVGIRDTNVVGPAVVP